MKCPFNPPISSKCIFIREMYKIEGFYIQGWLCSIHQAHIIMLGFFLSCQTPQDDLDFLSNKLTFSY